MIASGRVYLVGAGPGDPDLLTVKAARLLGEVDVILHDDLVPQAILDLAQEDATIVNVGKRCGNKSITQRQIHELMIEHAQRGLRVARLKSGDPLIFGRAGEEIEALSEAGFAVEVIPGITAASAAAAAIPASLTDRRAASSILFASGHRAPLDAGEETTDGPTRVVYMPGRQLHALAAAWQAEGLPEDLPCAVISRAAQPDQRILHVTLSVLGSTEPGPAPVLVIGGAVLRLKS